MSKISNMLNKDKNLYISDPCWCDKHPGFKEKYNSLDENDKNDFDNFCNNVNRKVLKAEKHFVKIADRLAEKYNSLHNTDDKDYDVFKDAVKTDGDKIMKNVDHPSQVINQEINRPSHYGSKSGKDVIDWCEDFGIMNNAYIFNIFKYLCRAGKKNNNSELQDALKAQIYLDRYIESLKK